MTRKCPRCGDQFQVQTIAQVRCVPCGVEVARLLEADAKRKDRFPAKDLTGAVYL